MGLTCNSHAILVQAADALPAAELPVSPTDAEFFEKKVRPILVERCLQCHGPDKQKGGLRLDSLKSLRRGGESGAVIVLGKPAESLLVEAVEYAGDYKMPPSGKLAAEEIAVLTDWVRRGAPWPAGTDSSATPTAAKPAPFDLTERKRRQWALQPVQRPALPNVARQDWGQSPIDQFILRRLEDAHLSPARPADRRTLLRRATFDLIGLPPTPVEIETFLNDREPGAFARVVDRLLASPHYGERWARHWLDLVRYAETYGHEFDFDIPHATEYRDYVIRAFNADVPYDQFVIEHIAGDLLPKPRRNPSPQNPFNESIIGTGFYFFGEAKHSPVDLRADQDEHIDNQIDVLGKTFLGMTLGCARCHDHKFDAISTKDYYALAGYLQSSRYQLVSVDAPDLREKLVGKLNELRAERDAHETVAILGRNDDASTATLAKYLLSAVQVFRDAGPDEKSPGSKRPDHQEIAAKIAREKNLPVAELTRWVNCLQDANSPSGKLFAPWLSWAKQSGDPQSNFERFRSDSLKRLKEAGKKELDFLENSTLFEDFSGHRFSRWFVTGDAFGAGPRRGIADSGTLSSRLQGTIRSRTFVIDAPWIHYKTAGRNARIRLVVDGLQLIRNPLYGHFEISFGDRSPANLEWRSQSVGKFLGHRAYIELVDDGDGELAVDEIRFSDQSPPPPIAKSDWALLLYRPEVTSPARWAEACAKVMHSRLINLDRRILESPGPELLDEMVLTTSLVELDTRVDEWLLDQNRHNWFPAGLGSKETGTLAELASLERRSAECESKIEYSRRALTIGDGSPENEPVHLRGNYKFAGEVVPRRFLEALGGTRIAAPKNGSGRLELAQQIANAENPLTARVMVNRVWKQHFGEGLVRTPDDFGNMGRPPTHPELLDFLATEFVRQGWSLKQLHRMLLLSSTYQMSSRPDDAQAEQSDPQNLWLHRMPIRRLEAEAIRDAILAVSGRLNRRMFGPSVTPHLTPFMEGRGRPAHSGPLDGEGRRTLYLSTRRNFLNPFLLAFDVPIPFATMGKRNVTNVPAQALALMNNPFVIQQAEQWARRTLAMQKDSALRVSDMYLTAFGRPPTPEELAAAQTFVASSAGQAPERVFQSWADLAHVLMNVTEFVFVN